MSQSITGHFDGKVIIPEGSVNFPIGERLRIRLDLDRSNGEKAGKGRKLIGTGEFSSGVSDLATNKKHMEGFGKS